MHCCHYCDSLKVCINLEFPGEKSHERILLAIPVSSDYNTGLNFIKYSSEE